MRKQLEDYSEPLPTGLWESIEKDLNQSSVQPKVIPLWRRWQTVAAAIVAVLVVSSTVVWLWRTDDESLTECAPLVADGLPSEPMDDSLLPVTEDITEPESVVEQGLSGATSLLASVTPSSVSSDVSPVSSSPVVMDMNPVVFSVDKSEIRKKKSVLRTL